MQSCDIKRFADWWKGDDAFRARFEANPAGAVAEYGIRVDPAAVRPLCDPDAASDAAAEPRLAPYYEDLRAHDALYEELERLDATVLDPAFADWRQRQRQRFSTQAPDAWGRRNPHLMFAIELSDGCSIQCPFCAGAPDRLRAVSRFTPESEARFRSVLRAIAAASRCATPSGLLYYFTEPLDNPDYERYLEVCLEELGRLPQTTTAAWARRPERTRRLLAMARERDGGAQRFSVNSVEAFRSCMALFTAEELRHVILVPHYPESGGVYYRSGRAGGRADAIDGSIACVSGFLVNLPSGTIQLVSPCIEPARWPRGFRSLAASTLESDADLATFIETARATVLDRVLHDGAPIELRRDLSLQQDADGTLRLRSRYRTFTLRGGLQDSVVRRCTERRTVADVIEASAAEHPAPEVFAFLQLLWDKGLLEDGPQP
jgi:hypothetical protein